MQLVSLTEQEFSRFAKLVRERTGIHLPKEKSAMLSNRLRRRLRALKLDSFEEYHRLLSNRARCDEELPYFLSAVTTNETYFFRNERLWKTLADEMIPHFVAAKAKRKKTLSVWSAASSSGEEAYSAAIVLREKLPDFDRWDVTLVGTDLSSKMLDHANAAVYNEYAISKTGDERLRRWFVHKTDGYHLRDEIRRMVRFRSHDLRQPLSGARFDLVILRNVLMYFDTPTKQQVIRVASDAVAPNGFLYVGDVDPIRTSPEFRGCMTLEHGGPGVYHRRVDGAAAANDKRGVTT